MLKYVHLSIVMPWKDNSQTWVTLITQKWHILGRKKLSLAFIKINRKQFIQWLYLLIETTCTDTDIN